MSLRGVGLAAALSLVTIAATRRATGVVVHHGWADEFASARTSGISYFSSSGVIDHFWDGNYTAGWPVPNQRWAILGAQGSNAGGRANAREKFMIDIADATSTACTNMTVTLDRWRKTSPPVVGSSCTGTGQTYVAGSSYTYTSCSAPVEDHYHNHRLLPTMNFSLETAVGAYIGYRSRMTVVNNQGGQVAYEDGCFKIWWLP